MAPLSVGGQGAATAPIVHGAAAQTHRISGLTGSKPSFLIISLKKLVLF
jgi:hypothetical protein